MKSNRLILKISCGLLILSIISSLGITAFGENTSIYTDMMEKEKSAFSARLASSLNGVYSNNIKCKPKGIHRKNGKWMEKALDELVEEGTITKDKAEKILKYREEKYKKRKKMTEEERKSERFTKKMLLEELVDARIITEEDADAIRNKRIQMHDEKISEKLSGLVSKWTITESEAVKIKEYLVTYREERMKEFKKIKGMTEEERIEYFKYNKNMKKDVMEIMVEDKVITEKQAKEIRKVFPKYGKCRYGDHKPKH